MRLELGYFAGAGSLILGLDDATATLTLCSARLTFGTFTHLPDSTFGTNTGAMHNDLYFMVLHLWTVWTQ